MRQCIAKAVTTGVQCRCSRGIDEKGYCKSHWQQGLPCCGVIAQSTGKPCQTRIDLDEDGRCQYHPKIKCCGTTNKGPCKKRPKPGSKYCCAKHDPSIPYVDPGEFGIYNIRDTSVTSVVKRWDDKDPYTKKTLSFDQISDKIGHQFDHIFEKQCFAYAVAHTKKLKDEDRNDIVAVLREEVVNEDDNLCLTAKYVNQLKGQGVYNFLDDRATGHLLGYDLTSYLIKAEKERADERLSRQVTGRICTEMRKSANSAKVWLADQGDTSCDAVAEELQQLIVDMQLC